CLPSSLAPLDLPSFPTRRSSDLMQVVVAMLAFEFGYLSLNWRPPSASAPRFFSKHSLIVSDVAAAWLTVGAIGLSLLGIVIWGPDRKSTRLNSSHSQISYAVFCL